MSYDKAVTCKGTKVEIRPSKKATSGTPNGKASAGRVNAQVETNDGKNVEHLLIETIPGADKMASQSNNYDGDMFKFMDELLTHEGGHNVFKATLKKKGLESASAQEQPGAWKQFLPSFLTAYTNTVNLRDTQFRYLEHEQRKPFYMSSTEYARRLATVVDLSKQFEGVKPEPNDDELKDMFLRGHPKNYVLEYAKSKNYNTDTIEDITRFMDILHDADVISGKIKELEEKQKKKKKAALLEEDDRYEGRVERRSRTRNGKSSRDNRRRNERDGRSEKKRYLRDDEPCPVHPNGKHTWGQCSLNPKNKNRDDDKRRERDNDKKRKKDEVRHHSHYQYESASASEYDESTGDNDSYYTASSRDSRGYSDEESVKKVKKTKSSKKTKKAKKSRKKDAAYQIHSGASEDQEPLKNDGGNLYNDE